MSLKKNVIANYLGQAWTALVGLVFVPVYIKYLGAESYGLIGVFTLLHACLAILDMGMTPTLNREMARFTAGAHTPQSIRDLLRSLEVIAFAMAGAIVLLVWAASGWLASDWLQVERLPIETVSQAIAIMGVVVALRFAEGIYRGAILGLQRQVLFNAVNSLFATLRAVGAVAVLVWVSPTIEAYFLWQGIVSIGSLIVLGVVAHKHIPQPARSPRFSRKAVSEVWRFAGGMMVTTFLVLLLMQVDKILLSRLLSLESFGYYSLAAVVASAISLLVSPVAQAFYPRFSEIVAHGDTLELGRVYHRGAQLVTALAAPAALMLVFFNERILQVWTGDSALVHEVAPLLTLLAVGNLLNGLMMIPYMLTLAYGWSSFAVRINTVAVVVLVPAIIWATLRYGAVGAAWTWVLLNAGYVVLGIHYLHRRLLPHEMWKWYWQDVALPLAGAAAVVALCSSFKLDGGTGISTLSLILAVAAGSTVLAAMLAPAIRQSMFKLLADMRLSK